MNLQAVEHLIKVERNECNKKKENEKKNSRESSRMGNERTRMLGLPITLAPPISSCNLTHKGSFSKAKRMHKRIEYVNY